jgi:imidazolonepropionase-like amidohydrolase
MTAMRGYRADCAFDGERVRPGGVLVLVRDGRIAGVEPGSAAAPDGCEVTHLPGTTLLPGLVEAHTHLCGDNGPRALDQLPELDAGALAEKVEAGLRMQLAAGVTAVRDLGDRAYAAVQRRDRGGDGPTVVASGPPITSAGGHCAGMGGEVSGVDGLRAAVRERAERGVDFVKIMTSGGAMTMGTDLLSCQFTLDELRVVVDEAHRLGLPVTAHAHALPAVERAVQAGVDGIEHCTCLVEGGIELPDALLEAIVSAGIEVCPTLGKTPDAVPSPRVREMMRRTGFTFAKRQAFAAGMGLRGVRLVSGTDGGISAGKPHGILATAVADLVAGGLPASKALASATSVAAGACGFGDRKGRVRPGFDADLLVVAGDPAADIGMLAQVKSVMVQGSMVSGPG